MKSNGSEMNDEYDEYDVVIDVLTKHAQDLWKITERNMRSEYIGMNIMDDIRLKQIERIDEAIRVWKNHCHNVVKKQQS